MKGYPVRVVTSSRDVPLDNPRFDEGRAVLKSAYGQAEALVDANVPHRCHLGM